MNMYALVHDLLDGYRLPVDGTHGVYHWARVLENGVRLAAVTKAKAEIVTLFALFHDSRRVNEDEDPGHGLRGAELAAAMRGRQFQLSDEDFELLYTACAHHTDGLVEGDVTVQTCWDADRLDLARVGITPAPPYLCTAYAKTEEVLRWANERALAGFVPDFTKQWGLPETKRRSWKHGSSGAGEGTPAHPHKPWWRLW
jgi:uncharacterized protein